LADELKKTLGVEAKLIAGSGGIFEVISDGKKVFAKAETGRFPTEGEVTDVLKD
jgi:selenoprotein W-related protein